MKFKLVAALIALALVGVASANLLTNEGSEIRAVTGPAAAEGWPYSVARQEFWTAQAGAKGTGFYSWTAGNYGAFGQDACSNTMRGDVVTFSIWGQVQNFSSTTSECWLQLEFWTNNATTYSVKNMNSVYNAIVSDRFSWNQYSMVATASVENVTIVKPIIGYGNAGADIGGDQAVKWDNANLSVAAIPEPMSAMLLGIGLYGVAWIRRLIRK